MVKLCYKRHDMLCYITHAILCYITHDYVIKHMICYVI